MLLFKTNAKPTISYYPVSFENEEEVKELISPMIPELFGAVLLETEFQIPSDGHDSRKGAFIDALAYHPKTQTFLIIEYKAEGSSANASNDPCGQVRHYAQNFIKDMKLLALHTKVTNLIKTKAKKRFTQEVCKTRLVVIKPFAENKPPFSNEIIAGAKGEGGREEVELYGIKRFENNLLFVEQLAGTPIQAINTTSKRRGKYNERHFTKKMTPAVRKAYKNYKAAIEVLCQPSNGLEFAYNKHYIKFTSQGEVFAGLIRRTKQLQFILNLQTDELSDVDGLAQLKTRSYGAGDYGIDNAEQKDFDQVMSLIRQAYDKRVGEASITSAPITSASTTPTPITSAPVTPDPISDSRDTYDEQYFIDRMESAVLEAYKRHKAGMEALCQSPNNLEFVYDKKYINFISQGKILGRIISRADQPILELKLYLNLQEGELIDPYDLTRLLPPRPNGKRHYCIENAEQKDIDQIMDLIRQAYDKRVLGN